MADATDNAIYLYDLGRARRCVSPRARPLSGNVGDGDGDGGADVNGQEHTSPCTHVRALAGADVRSRERCPKQSILFWEFSQARLGLSKEEIELGSRGSSTQRWRLCAHIMATVVIEADLGNVSHIIAAEMAGAHYSPLNNQLRFLSSELVDDASFEQVTLAVLSMRRCSNSYCHALLVHERLAMNARQVYVRVHDANCCVTARHLSPAVVVILPFCIIVHRADEGSMAQQCLCRQTSALVATKESRCYGKMPSTSLSFSSSLPLPPVSFSPPLLYSPFPSLAPSHPLPPPFFSEFALHALHSPSPPFVALSALTLLLHVSCLHAHRSA
eukprot:6207245-Pleurochrysis_carterae.AAC.2